MRAGKKERQLLQLELKAGKISKAEFYKRTHDAKKGIRRILAHKRIAPKDYSHFKKWIEKQLERRIKKVEFHKPQKALVYPGQNLSNEALVYPGQEERIVIQDTTSDERDEVDMSSLEGERELSDIVVEKYLDLLCNTSTIRIFAFDPRFFTSLVQNEKKVQKWGRRLTTHDEFLVPICQRNHWSLIHGVLKEKSITLYDSGIPNVVRQSGYLMKIASYMSKSTNTDEDEWRISIESRCPRQGNGDVKNCGIYLCQYAKHITRRQKPIPPCPCCNWIFSTQTITTLRKTIRKEIEKEKIKENIFRMDIDPNEEVTTDVEAASDSDEDSKIIENGDENVRDGETSHLDQEEDVKIEEEEGIMNYELDSNEEEGEIKEDDDEDKIDEEDRDWRRR